MQALDIGYCCIETLVCLFDGDLSDILSCGGRIRD